MAGLQIDGVEPCAGGFKPEGSRKMPEENRMQAAVAEEGIKEQQGQAVNLWPVQGVFKCIKCGTWCTWKLPDGRCLNMLHYERPMHGQPDEKYWIDRREYIAQVEYSCRECGTTHLITLVPLGTVVKL